MSKLRNFLRRAVSPDSSSKDRKSSGSRSRDGDASEIRPQSASTENESDIAAGVKRLSISSNVSTERNIQSKPLSDTVPRESHGVPASTSTSTPTPTSERLQSVPAHLKEKLKGKLKLEHSTDTTYHETVAKAVTHETVTRRHHEVRHEIIDRDIHTYDVHHRILPVIDVQVLPAKHFVRASDGTLTQVPGDRVRGRTGSEQAWVIAETVTKMGPDVTAPRPFTARQFGPEDADVPEYVDEDGVKRSKTTWIHPPQIQTGAERTGQTVPFHFGSDNDGIRQ